MKLFKKFVQLFKKKKFGFNQIVEVEDKLSKGLKLTKREKENYEKAKKDVKYRGVKFLF